MRRCSLKRTTRQPERRTSSLPSASVKRKASIKCWRMISGSFCLEYVYCTERACIVAGCDRTFHALHGMQIES